MGSWSRGMIFASHFQNVICERSWVQFPQGPIRESLFTFFEPLSLGIGHHKIKYWSKALMVISEGDWVTMRREAESQY